VKPETKGTKPKVHKESTTRAGGFRLSRPALCAACAVQITLNN
jgi:hypothetical protein